MKKLKIISIILLLSLTTACTATDVIKTVTGLAGDKPGLAVDTQIGGNKNVLGDIDQRETEINAQVATVTQDKARDIDTKSNDIKAKVSEVSQDTARDVDSAINKNDIKALMSSISQDKVTNNSYSDVALWRDLLDKVLMFLFGGWLVTYLIRYTNYSDNTKPKVK